MFCLCNNLRTAKAVVVVVVVEWTKERTTVLWGGPGRGLIIPKLNREKRIPPFRLWKIRRIFSGHFFTHILQAAFTPISFRQKIRKHKMWVHKIFAKHLSKMLGKGQLDAFSTLYHYCLLKSLLQHQTFWGELLKHLSTLKKSTLSRPPNFFLMHV